MGTVTIDGKLSLTGIGTAHGTIFNIKTSKLVVTPGLSPVATIAFDQKVTLVLPSNVDLQVTTGGLTTVSGCSNNQEIKVGSTSIAFCSGSTTFTTIMNKGGYSANCPTFTLTGVSVPTAQCLSTASVTLTGSATALPVGTYTVTYNRNDPWTTGLTASMTVNTAGTGIFTAKGLTNPDNTGTRITVTNLASGSCSNTITVNNVSNTFVMRGALNAPTLDGIGFVSCSNYVVQILNQSPRATNYYLDVNTSPVLAVILTCQDI
jgi:hypothetical protein